MQRLVGHIPSISTPKRWDTIEPKDLIVVTYGSVLCGIGYRSWTISTAEEDILITGGGPDDGNPLLMKSYRSDLRQVWQ
jgi:hypothetical protein